MAEVLSIPDFPHQPGTSPVPRRRVPAGARADPRAHRRHCPRRAAAFRGAGHRAGTEADDGLVLAAAREPYGGADGVQAVFPGRKCGVSGSGRWMLATPLACSSPFARSGPAPFPKLSLLQLWFLPAFAPLHAGAFQLEGRGPLARAAA